ncbi:DUF1491 family protein [Xanthobacter sp. V3C-3]|uniref:DUF1491 family protein n=1 Tax=Xanthobacter lutulentifluminis TaxID=3119935 RepID=UPI00372A510C
MRLKSAIFVSALIRRAQVEGAFAAVVRRGAEEAGAIFVKVSQLDGTAALYGPAPQSAFDESAPADRLFSMIIAPGRPEADADARIARELKFDPDIFVVEIEDRAGRHFLDLAKA